MNLVGWVILGALVADAASRAIADALNLGRMGNGVPARFADVYDPGRYAAAHAYLRARTRFGWATDGFDLAALLLFWFAGGFPWLDRWSAGFGFGPINTGLVYMAALFSAKGALALPFDLYATFVIEAKYGFNRTTARVYIADLLKKWLLALGLGAPLAAAVLAFFIHAGSYGWWVCWLFVTGFMLAVQYLAPTWILPLFNRFEPLEDGPFKRDIVDYARSIGFPLDNVLVMDGSRRSTRSNAFFTGFGRHRRIVLFDTLIQRHTPEQLKAVLAHEMGHYKLHHIRRMMALTIAQTGILFFLLSFVLSWPPLFEAFGVGRPSVHAGLVFFAFLYTPAEFFLGLAVRHRSRCHEFAADRFAVETTGSGRELVTALKNLSVDNLTHLDPHPLHVWLNHSHPPIPSRIDAIEAAEREGEALA